MLSTRSRALVVAVLGVVALAFAAPAVQVADPATDPGDGAPPAGGDVASPSLPEGATTDGTSTLLSGVAFTLLLFAMGAVLLKNADSTVAAGLGGVVVVALLSGLFFVVSRGGSRGAAEPAAANGTPGTGTVGGGGAGGFAFAPVAVLLVGVVVVAGGVLVARRVGDAGSIGGSGGDGDEREGPDPDAVGRAAARAADRIRAESADNEVYRCWVELTGLVDAPNPETYTPAEFAEAAVAAGMDPDDVGELRRLFEDVRYGAADPETNEERALSVFERIEAGYAGDGADGGGEGGSA